MARDKRFILITVGHFYPLSSKGFDTDDIQAGDCWFARVHPTLEIDSSTLAVDISSALGNVGFCEVKLDVAANHIEIVTFSRHYAVEVITRVLNEKCPKHDVVASEAAK